MVRVIVISHPDFDLPGVEGVKRAKQIAEDLQTGNVQYIETLKKENAPKEILDAAIDFIDKLKYYIRKVNI